QSRLSAGQADPSIFGKQAWVRDFGTFGGKPGHCNDLAYNSGHLFVAHSVTVSAAGSMSETTDGCGSPNYYGHCCLP
ncbi:MAG: hypothetical protein ACO3JL_11015, partial [Myxococcota bacterium]